MSKRLLIALQAGFALGVAGLISVVAWLLTALLYIGIMDAACVFGKLLPFPSVWVTVLVYILYVIAITPWLYGWIKQRSRRRITT